MKLQRDALAVVTLGVGVQKDQLIQAVGQDARTGPRAANCSLCSAV